MAQLAKTQVIKNYVKDNKGSFIVESVILLPFLFFVITSFTFIFYLSICRLTVRQINYQSLLCALSSKSISVCKSEQNKKLNTILFFGNLKKYNLRKNDFNVTGEIIWQINTKMQIQDTQSLNRSHLQRTIEDFH